MKGRRERRKEVEGEKGKKKQNEGQEGRRGKRRESSSEEVSQRKCIAVHKY